MKTNPIYKLNGSGLSLGDIYSLTLTNDGNGSVYSVASIGTNGYTTKLSAIPSAGFQLSAFSANYGTINGNEYTFTNNDATVKAFFEESMFDTVTIGTQTWMSKNLAIDDGDEGILTANLSSVNGYDLGIQYLYTWDAAMRLASSTSADGYRMPNSADFDTLFKYCGGYGVAAGKLKSTYSWNNNGNGTDDYSFCLLPCGYRITQYNYSGQYNRLWSSETNYSNQAGNYYFSYDRNGISYEDFYSKTCYFSVRLIKE